MENKQLILDSLCSALQLTRDQADLEALEYKEIDPDEQRVIATYDGGESREINVSLDSGIAMIRDVLRAMK
jgi:hypothetical protein